MGKTSNINTSRSFWRRHLVRALLVTWRSGAGAGCADLKCEIDYDRCIDRCDNGGRICEAACKLDRQWCKL